MKRVDVTGKWFDDEEEGESPGSSEVKLRLGYGGDTLYVDGLDNGRYLCLPLSAVATAIAAGARQDA
jgi:hypothetical protein